MKYFLRKTNLPLEIIDIIYSYYDNFDEIKNLKKIWYQRLINSDYKFCFDIPSFLKRETRQLNMLLKNNAFDIIEKIHEKNLSYY